jgi:hypothetical protein
MSCPHPPFAGALGSSAPLDLEGLEQKAFVWQLLLAGGVQ